jgi:hypothetical protein
LKEFTHKETELIMQKVQAVKESGFGEVKICIRNGTIYRICTTEDTVIEPAKN